MLKHQLILHPDAVEKFAFDQPPTPYQQRPGFSWYLCPVTVAGKQEWLLVNVEFGYCQMVIAPEITPAYIADIALDVIEYHLPDGRDEDNVSVSLNIDDVTWHTAEKMPEHVAKRYQEARQRVARCKSVHDAEDVMERLNDKPLSVNGRTFAPTKIKETM
jgi:hypothetical protein